MNAKLPSAAAHVAAEHPELWQAYEQFGAASAAAGPLEGHTARLVKLALAAGAGLEGAVHSHVRRGLEEGIPADELRHVALLAMPTLGFPKAVALSTWIEDVLS